MSPVDKDKWQRTLALCGTIGVPLITLCCWLLINGTRLVDNVGDISKDQIAVHARLDLLDLKMDRMSHRIDTLATRQDRVGLFQEIHVNGRVMFVPAK